jgi:hypothetical protein
LMARRARIDPLGTGPQIAGYVRRDLVLPGGVAAIQRVVRINEERIAHIRARRPEWFAFCLAHVGEVLSRPDLLGHRLRGDPRRVEFVRLIAPAGRWVMVSVKFLDLRRQAWVNSAQPVAAVYLTRRLRAGTMHIVGRGP